MGMGNDKIGVISKYWGQNILFPKRKEATRAGTEGGSRKMQKQEGSPKVSCTTAVGSRKQLLVASDAVSLCTRGGSAVFTLSPWANCHSAIMHVVETIPSTRREACDVACLYSPSNTPTPK